jgi:hypothetical protein
MSVRTRYFATTLALLALGLGFGLRQWQPRPGPPRPAVHTTARPALPAPSPTAREMLARTDALGLSARQTERLRELARRWQAESGELQEAIRTASAEFEQFVAGARQGGGASLQTLQQHSGALRHLSMTLRERRAEHSRRAAGVLTEAQRATLHPQFEDSSGGRA